MLVGLSCHSLKDVRESLNVPADYLGFGPVFTTKTKPHVRPRGVNVLRRAAAATRRPVFAIGGIQYGTLDAILTATRRIAVCREICLAPHVMDATKRLKNKLNNPHV
jgi:thiamine-phosphate pyrophosphorylase